MIQENIFKQLETIYKICINNNHFFLVSIVAIGLLLLLIICNHFSNKKFTKIIAIILYIGIIGTLIYFFHSEILKFIDYLVDNIFILLFFPNLAVYTLILIIINVIVIKSFFGNNKVIKNINSVFFVLFNILFYLIIDNVIKNKIDVYEQLNVYTNNNLLILIQVSIYLFIIWLVILLIKYISGKITITVPVRETIGDMDLVPTRKISNKELSSIKELTPNTLVLDSKEITEINYDNEIKEPKVLDYNSYIDVVPMKKNKSYNLENMDGLFKTESIKKDMDIVFSNKTCLDSIMDDIDKLKYNHSDSNQIKKVYDNITLNSKDLTLNDYNYLINALKEIKNNN